MKNKVEVNYKRTANQSFMILTEEFYSGYDIEMLRKNKIKGFLSFETIVADGRQQYWYDISGKQSLEDYLKLHKVTGDFLLSLMQQIRNVSMEAERYLLLVQNINLKAELIYIDLHTEKLVFSYLPVQETSLEMKFQQLMEIILKRVDHEDKKSVEIAYEIYELSLEETNSVADILAQAMENRSTRTQTETHEVEEKSYEIEDCVEDEGEAETVEQPKKRKINSSLSLKLPEGLQALKEKTRTFLPIQRRKKENEAKIEYVYEPEEEEEPIANPTVLLNERVKIYGRLTYKGMDGEEDFILDTYPFVIGTNQDIANGCIHSKAVSRVHAQIDKVEDVFYIEDFNSKNGTYVDGELLNYKEPRKLEKNAVILFADVEYQFG